MTSVQAREQQAVMANKVLYWLLYAHFPPTNRMHPGQGSQPNREEMLPLRRLPVSWYARPG